MYYRKLVIILVILLIFYSAFQLMKETSDRELKDVKDISLYRGTPSNPVLLPKENEGNGFSMKIGSFICRQEEVLQSPRYEIKTYCAAKNNKLFSKFYSKFSCKDSEKKEIIVDFFVPIEKKKAKECLNLNSEVFSNESGIDYQKLELKGKTGFYIEGEYSSLQLRMIYSVDSRDNYIIFKTNPLELEKNFPSKKEMISFASNFNYTGV